MQYNKIESLKEALDDPNSKVGSIYELKYAQKTSLLGANLKSGKAIFTEPEHSIKCGGAPRTYFICGTINEKWESSQLKHCL